MVRISDLNRREREVRKSLSDLEKQLKEKSISGADYKRMKREKENELNGIESERKSVIEKLPPMPPPPKPSRPPSAAVPRPLPRETDQVQIELKKHEKDLLFTQSEMSKLFAEVVKNREKIRRVEEMVRGIESEVSKSPQVDTGAIDRKFSSQLERIEAAMKNTVSKSREDVDRMAGDIRNLKRDVEEFRKTRDVMNTMDISGLRRDIESLKSKATWLEKQMENLDIEPLYELIKEIEGRVSSASRSQSPVIIE
jgi:hypothetical protein